jgi:hypothetical protein
MDDTDLQDIRQLCDVATEEAHADLWTRHQLTPGAAGNLLAEVDSVRMAMPPKSPPRRPRRDRFDWRLSA